MQTVLHYSLMWKEYWNTGIGTLVLEHGYCNTVLEHRYWNLVLEHWYWNTVLEHRYWNTGTGTQALKHRY